MVASTRPAVGGKNAPQLESYDTPGAYAYASLDDAKRHTIARVAAHRQSHGQLCKTGSGSLRHRVNAFGCSG